MVRLAVLQEAWHFVVREFVGCCLIDSADVGSTPTLVGHQAIVVATEFVDRVVRRRQVHALDENDQNHPIHVNLDFPCVTLFRTYSGNRSGGGVCMYASGLTNVAVDSKPQLHDSGYHARNEHVTLTTL